MFQKHDHPFYQAFRRKAHIFPAKKVQVVDMTQGGILLHLIRFAVPMLFGSIFSLLYSTIDSWVIGNFGSNESYAAIGCVGSIINVLTWSSNGLGGGVSIYLAQKVGARKTEDMDQAVHSACTAFFLLGVVLSIVGITSSSFTLRLLDTPEEIISEGLTYMNIYYLILPASLLAQVAANTLRSMGKPGVPVVIGSVGAVLNTILDLVFVIFLDMGIAGVAWATLIVIYLEAVLYLIALSKKNELFSFRFSKLRLHLASLRNIFSLGFPIALQMTINSISVALVQSYVNHFGSDCISAWYTYRKVQSFLETPIGPVITAVSVFVAQNMGALKLDRIKKSLRTSTLMCLVICGVGATFSTIFAAPFSAFFNSKEEVVAISVNLLRLFTPLLFFNNFVNLHVSYFRGMGNTRTPMILSVSTFTVFRQICMIAVLNIFDNFYIVTAMFPLTWLVASAIIAPYFHHYFKKKQQELCTKEPITS